MFGLRRAWDRRMRRGRASRVDATGMRRPSPRHSTRSTRLAARSGRPCDEARDEMRQAFDEARDEVREAFDEVRVADGVSDDPCQPTPPHSPAPAPARGGRRASGADRARHAGDRGRGCSRRFRRAPWSRSATDRSADSQGRSADRRHRPLGAADSHRRPGDLGDRGAGQGRCPPRTTSTRSSNWLDPEVPAPGRPRRGCWMPWLWRRESKPVVKDYGTLYEAELKLDALAPAPYRTGRGVSTASWSSTGW